MMKKSGVFVYCVAVFCAAILALSAAAQPQEDGPQRLPRALHADSHVSSGTLANGIKYYIVTNATEPGLAEFAIVRRHTPSESPDQSEQLARASITDIPRFSGKSSRTFLSEAGGFASQTAALGRTGLATARDNATIYRFGTLPVSGRDAAIDSAILLTFNVIESLQENGNLPKDYSTSDNAIIISGDIDAADILEKLNNFSLIVPQIIPEKVEIQQYKWEPRDSVICTVQTDHFAKTALLSVSYSSPRTPELLMGTSLPVVSEHLGDILSIVLKKRLILQLKDNDIPLASAGCRYMKSSDQPGDEVYEISVRTAPEYVADACRTIASIVSDIDNYGVPSKEYIDARNEYLTGLYNESMQTVTPNDTYVMRCISAFLYGTTPISDSERCELLTRSGRDSTRTRHFNNFARELLDSTRNLTIRLQSPSSDMSPEELRTIFTSAWTPADGDHIRISNYVNQTDTITFETSPDKVKAKYHRSETVSGGDYWQFSNGMKVVYKRMATEGMFYYNLLIRGGYSSMDGLSQGEGAFLNDIIRTYGVGDLRNEDFQNLLLTNGITMSSEVKISDMSIYGTAKLASLTLLMKALTTLANDRTADSKTYEYYRRCELMRLRQQKGDLESRKAVIDSLFCPDYRYGSGKTATALYPDLDTKAMAFFDEQFSRVNDGILVIVGDMNEDLMKKFLSKNLGGFKTTDRISNRKRINYKPINGPITYFEDGDKVSVDVFLSSPLSYTAENYMAVKVAAVAVQDMLNRNLCGTGAVAKVDGDFMSYPQERAILEVNVETLEQGSLPLDESRTGAVNLLFKVREALSDPVIDPERLSFYKAIVKSEIDGRQDDPWYWIEMVKTRISDVKDLNTKYSKKIDAVTADQVTELIKTIASGSRVEYVVR